MSTQMLIVMAVIGLGALVVNPRNNWGMLGLALAFVAVLALVFRVL